MFGFAAKCSVRSDRTDTLQHCLRHSGPHGGNGHRNRVRVHRPEPRGYTNQSNGYLTSGCLCVFRCHESFGTQLRKCAQCSRRRGAISHCRNKVWGHDDNVNGCACVGCVMKRSITIIQFCPIWVALFTATMHNRKNHSTCLHVTMQHARRKLRGCHSIRTNEHNEK